MFYLRPLMCLKRREDVILISLDFKFSCSGSKEELFCVESVLSLRIHMALISTPYSKLPFVSQSNVSLFSKLKQFPHQKPVKY